LKNLVSFLLDRNMANLVKTSKIGEIDGLNWSEVGAWEDVAFQPKALCGLPQGGERSYALRNSELEQA
jgi:hypothetical protein